jgi:hypothetical protein
MEVYRSKQYGAFSEGYKAEALKAYKAFRKSHFEFLREDVIAASCCIEHISLLAPEDALVKELLGEALLLAGENYDVLQQSILVNLQLERFDEVIPPLREMIANGYNVGLNGILLSRIYFTESNKTEYEKLRVIAGEDNILPWSDDANLAAKSLVDVGEDNVSPQSDDANLAAKRLVDDRKSRVADEYSAMAKRIIVRLKTKKKDADTSAIFNGFKAISELLQEYTGDDKELAKLFKRAKDKLKSAAVNTNDKTLREFIDAAEKTRTKLLSAEFTMQIVDDMPTVIGKMNEVAK